MKSKPFPRITRRSALPGHGKSPPISLTICALGLNSLLLSRMIRSSKDFVRGSLNILLTAFLRVDNTASAETA